MADGFLSYKREDAMRVLALVEGLRREGVSIWWDKDIAPDAPWEATIEHELDAAKVVIVAWSKASVVSDNVKSEARRARNHGKLIQVFVEPCDPPLFFGERQGVDLTNWNGSLNDDRFRNILAAAKAVIAGGRPQPGVGFRPRSRSLPRILLASAAVSFGILALLADIGGARDLVCSVTPALGACRTTIPPRSALFREVAGVWGNPSREGQDACLFTERYAIDRRDNGIDILTISSEGSRQELVIETAEGDRMTGRIVGPNADAGVRVDIQLSAGELSHSTMRQTQFGMREATTSLVRCAD